MQRHNRNYDSNIRCSQLPKDDIVFVKRKVFWGKHKIQDRRESKPYVIMEKRHDDLPVYKVKPCQGDSKERPLQRNMLFPSLNAYGNENMDFQDWHMDSIEELKIFNLGILWKLVK